MSSVGIQALLLPLLGIHSAVTHHELMGVFEIARGLGTSYRFASSEPGSGCPPGPLHAECLQGHRRRRQAFDALDGFPVERPARRVRCAGQCASAAG